METELNEDADLVLARPREIVTPTFDEIEGFSDRVAIEKSVVVVVDSADCFPVVMPRSERRSLPNRNSLAYEVEGAIPFDGDQLALATIASRSSWLVIATDAAAIEPQIEQLADEGMYVRAIVPTLFLAWPTLARVERLRDVDTVLWQSAKGIDVAKLSNGVPCDWRWISTDTDSVAMILDELNEDSGGLLAVNCSAEVVAAFDDRFDVQRLDLDRDVAATSESKLIVNGRARPMIDLRDGLISANDPLYPVKRSVFAFAFFFVAMQLAVIAAMLIRDGQYRQQSAEFIEQQEVIYKQVFPDQRIPVGIVSRLESERRRLAGTRGMADDEVPDAGSVVPICHSLLGALPDSAKARFRIDRMTFSPDSFDIKGVAKTYADLEAVSNGLTQAGFDIPPISATKTNEGVSLRFDGIQLLATDEKDPVTGDLR